MLTVYGQERYTNVEEHKINYFYIGISNTLIIRNINGITTILNHSDNTELKKTIQKISNALRKYLVTIGTITTVMFINVSNINSYTRSGTNINIIFNNSDYTDIELFTENESVNTYDYIHNVYLSANLEDYIHDKVKHYVNPSYEENLTQRKYQTWTRALQYASSGDVVILEKATYRNLEVLLKDGVDAVMQDCIIDSYGVNNRASIMDSIPLDTNPVDCKIFGNGIFYYKYPLRSYHWLMLDIHSVSNVYFEFDSAYSEDAGATSFFHQWRGKIWTKGNLLYSDVTRTYDSESNIEGISLLFDNDIAYHITENGSIMYVPFSGYTSTFYFRNTYMENNGTGDPEYNGGDMLSINETYIFNNNIINSRYNAKHIYDGLVSSSVLYNQSDTGTNDSSFRIWSSEFYNINATQENISMPLGTELYPIKTILNSTANRNSDVTYEEPSLVTVDNTFTMARGNFTDIIFDKSYFIKYTPDNILTNYDELMTRKEYVMITSTANNNLLTEINELYPSQSTILTDIYSIKYLINIDKVHEIFKDTLTNRIFLVFANYELWYETTTAYLNNDYTALVNLKSNWLTLKQTFNDI